MKPICAFLSSVSFSCLYALRSLWRSPSRTILTLSMVAVGTFVATLSLALGMGAYTTIIKIVTQSGIGDYQLLPEASLRRPDFFATFPFAPNSPLRMLLADFGLTYSPRAETAGVLASESTSAGVQLIGIDPEREPTVSRLHQTITQGAFFTSHATPGRDKTQTSIISHEDPPELISPEQTAPRRIFALIGLTLAQKLAASPGSEISFMSQAANGSIVAEIFTVKGVFDLGNPMQNFRTVFVPIDDFQDMTALDRQVHRVLIRDNPQEPLDADVLATQVSALKNTLSDGKSYPPDSPVVLVNWRMIAPELHGSIEADRKGNIILLAFVLVIVLLGVSNTMMMSAYERSHEVGLLKALGTQIHHILLMLHIEAFLLVTTGAAIGALLSWCVAPIVSIPLGENGMSWAGVVIRSMDAHPTLGDYAGSAAAIILCGLLASLPPVLRVVRMTIIEALREEGP